MKNFVIFTVILCLGVCAFAAERDIKEEKSKIRLVVESAYIEGVFLEGNAKKMQKGFDKCFNIQILRLEDVDLLPISKWLEITKKNIADGKYKGENPYTYKIPMIDVTGNAAVVKVEIYKHNKIHFTDYLSLYRFKSGWRIVNKIYNPHFKK